MGACFNVALLRAELLLQKILRHIPKPQEKRCSLRVWEVVAL